MALNVWGGLNNWGDSSGATYEASTIFASWSQTINQVESVNEASLGESVSSNLSTDATLNSQAIQHFSSKQNLSLSCYKVVDETLQLSVSSSLQVSLGNVFNELLTLESSSSDTQSINCLYAGEITLSATSIVSNVTGVTYDVSIELPSLVTSGYLAGNVFDEISTLESAVALTVETAFAELVQTPTRRTLYISSENRVVTIIAAKRN